MRLLLQMLPVKHSIADAVSLSSISSCSHAVNAISVQIFIVNMKQVHNPPLETTSQIGRLALGNVVVDREIITGIETNGQGVAECMATYVVDTDSTPMLIKKITFVWKPRTFMAKLA